MNGDELIRRARICMNAAITDLPATMLLQVHDELLFEVEEDAADALAARVKAVMEEAAAECERHADRIEALVKEVNLHKTRTDLTQSQSDESFCAKKDRTDE